MKPRIKAFFVALCAAAPLAQAALPAHPRPIYVEGKVLVKYRAGVSTTLVAAKRSMGLRAISSHLGGRIETLQLPAMTTVAQTLAALRADPAIEYAEPDFLRVPRAVAVPNDTYFGDQWGLYSTGQPNFASSDPALASIPGDDMDLLAAWDPAGDGTFPRVGDGSATVAIIDDSVHTGHEDLAANIVAGYDFLHNDNNPNPDPGSDQGHGTMVAGCVGAVGNNGKGVAGVAWNVKLMPLKFAFDTDTFLAAMDFARTNGANIVNASFGGPGYSQAEIDGIQALADADILFVAAAGNDDSNTDVAELNYPANYPVDNIVSVAATNRQDNIASFSQFGPRTVDVAAPGLQVVTTTNSSSYSTDPGVSGTSFASPYTAGVAALMKMQDPAATFGELKARLIEGAEPAGNVNHRTAGGRVNAAQSLDLVARPSLVVTGWTWVDSNGVMDSGEATQVDVTLSNLWQDATTVAATLSADNGVTISNGSVSFGDIAGGTSVTRRFDVTVPAGITDHRYVDFTLAVSADGPYSAERHYIDEIGELTTTQVSQDFAPISTDLYDEFHAWHFNLDALPIGHDQLVIQTTTPNGTDIDLLVKKDAPPQYDITVGINPEFDQGFFCTSGATSDCQDPDVHLSAGVDGNETVVIDNPTLGTYHIVIVNFAQLQGGLTYTLHAYTRMAPAPPGNVGGGGSGNGALGGALLAPFVLVAALRRRTRRA